MPTTSWPAIDESLLEQAATTYGFKLGTPTPLAITKDGAVLFRRTPPRSFASDLYEMAPDGTITTLATVAELMGAGEEKLSDAEKARRERSRTATRGVVDVGVSDDGKTVFVPLGGMFHLIDRTTKQRRTLDPKGEAYDPQLSPDGSMIAFVRGGDVWVVGSGAPRQLTKHPEGFEYGVADFAAQEELGRRRGHWWSPDSKHVVFERADNRPVDTIYVADARHNDKPPVPFKYPRAGTNNAVVDLGIVPASSTSEPRWLTWDLGAHPYLVDVYWPEKGPLAALVLDRDQTDAVLLSFDPATGKSSTLLTEHDDTWVNVPAWAPRWLEDGSGFLWMTEKTGDWTLELHKGGTVKQLTATELGLRHLVGIEPNAAIVEAGTDPTIQDVFRVPFDGSAPVRLTNSDGVAGGTAKHGTVIVSSMLAKGGHSIYAVTSSGKHELPSVAEHPKLVPTTVLETVDIGGRKHHVAITRPRAFDPAIKYPVILKVYGGPHAVTVLAARDSYVMDQWYADAGFIVVRSDNRGTPNRGRAWERAILKDLVSIPMDDQVAALQAIGARYKELDLDRVGIVGWSFGGYMSAMGVLLRPDIFKAAVAGAPVTDWALYDTAYTERYMKTPQVNPDGYKKTSAMTYADKLSRPLLIIHGITDDNVHFAHTLALIEAMYVAGKRAELITLSATHMVPDPKLSLAREQVQIDFFRSHLGHK